MRPKGRARGGEEAFHRVEFQIRVSHGRYWRHSNRDSTLTCSHSPSFFRPFLFYRPLLSRRRFVVTKRSTKAGREGSLDSHWRIALEMIANIIGLWKFRLTFGKSGAFVEIIRRRSRPLLGCVLSALGHKDRKRIFFSSASSSSFKILF